MRTPQRRKGHIPIEEERAIHEALVRNGYILSRTAEDVGMCTATLVYRLIRMGIYDQVKKMAPKELRKKEKPSKFGNLRKTFLKNEIEFAYAQLDHKLEPTAKWLGMTPIALKGWLSGKQEDFWVHKGSRLWHKERELIEKVLFKHDGNRTFAALELGMSLRNLRRKLQMYREYDELERVNP